MIVKHIRTAVPHAGSEMVILPMEEQRNGLPLGLAALHGGNTCLSQPAGDLLMHYGDGRSATTVVSYKPTMANLMDSQVIMIMNNATIAPLLVCWLLRKKSSMSTLRQRILLWRYMQANVVLATEFAGIG
mmetsp:Transcript_10166/g.24300  ORF Transcript_10166/g.24300 Transcript_10166/m.24300 type:complete len:130 (-) Transcript_10166:431-820(-)